MFASRRFVPFDSKPVTGGSAHLANITDGTEGAVVGEALPRSVLAVLCHFVS